MLIELNEILPKFKDVLKKEFELQEDDVMNSTYLLNYNIKPRDVLEIVPPKDMEKFCTKQQIKTRGDLVLNTLAFYKDSDNIYLENYEAVGFRDIPTLKDNGINVSGDDLGTLYEDLTKKIFTRLRFNVDEQLRKKLNTSKDKMDIILNMGDNQVIVIECKSAKNSYNKFSSVSRQLKAYNALAEKNDHKVIKSLLVAPEFTDEFVKDCGLDYEMNLSLITAGSLTKILNAFKASKHKTFPTNLLMRDVLIQEDRVIKAMGK